MREQPKFKGHLLIALTSYRMEVDQRVTDAMERAQHELMAQGWLSTRVTYGSADLCDARNTLASQFYATPEYTNILLWDSDVSCESGAVTRMVNHNVSFVCGVYPLRDDSGQYPARTIPGEIECVNPVDEKPHPHGLIKLAGAPGGFMMLSRQVVERLIDADPDNWYAQSKVTGGKAWDLFKFDVDREKHERISEDMNLCYKWIQLGGTVWCDPHLVLHHHGFKTYSGRLIDHLKNIGRLKEIAGNGNLQGQAQA